MAVWLGDLKYAKDSKLIGYFSAATDLTELTVQIGAI